MSDSIFDISQNHGKEMRRLALQHALEIAKICRDYSDKPIEELISHLEEKLVSEEVENDVL